MRYLLFACLLFVGQSFAADLVIPASHDDVKNAIIADLTGRDFTLDTETPSHVILSKPIGGAGLEIANFFAHDGETDSRVQFDFLILKTEAGTKVIASKYAATSIGSGKVERHKVDDGDLPVFLNEIQTELAK